MKTLLVPCDFSQPSLHALQFALDAAERSSGGTVHVLHIIELPVLHDSVLMPVLSFEQDLLNELKQKAEEQFAIIRKKYKFTGSMITEVRFGKIWEMIRHYVQEHAVDAIIMGSHGASGIREVFIGSNAGKVVRNATVPVLVIKNQYKGPIKNIVFPNTLHPEDQKDLMINLKALQKFFKAHLHLVWINTPINFTSDSVTRKRLNEFALRHSLKDYTIHVYNHINPEDGILEFADTLDAPLIAMGTHGRKGLARLMQSSLTESVVNHTDRLMWSYVMKDEPAEV